MPVVSSDSSDIVMMNYTVVIPTLSPGYGSARSPRLGQSVDSLQFLPTTPYLTSNLSVSAAGATIVDNISEYNASLTTPDRPLAATITLAIALGIIVILTITGNVLVIASVALQANLRTTTNYFIANLAIADLLLGTTVLPFSATLEVLQYWVFGQIFCDIWAAIDVLCCTASILSLCVISIDRYIGVTRPLQHARIMRHARAIYVIIFVWLLSATISVAPLIGWKEEPDPDPRVCTVTTQPGYVLFSVAGSFYIPCLIILLVYFRIYKETVRYTKCLKAGAKTARVDEENVISLRIHTGRNFNNGHATSYQNPESSTGSTNEGVENIAVDDFTGTNGNNSLANTLSNNSSIMGNQAPRKGNSASNPKRVSRLAFSNKVARFKREKKAAKTLGIVVGVFITCWLPFFIILPLDSLCPACSVPPLLFKLFFWLGYCNSTMNPIIYTCSSCEFRRAFLSILCCRRCRQRPKISLTELQMRTTRHSNGQRTGVPLTQQQQQIYKQQQLQRRQLNGFENQHRDQIFELSLSKKSNSSGSSTFNATSSDDDASRAASPNKPGPTEDLSKQDVTESEMSNMPPSQQISIEPKIRQSHNDASASIDSPCSDKGISFGNSVYEAQNLYERSKNLVTRKKNFPRDFSIPRPFSEGDIRRSDRIILSEHSALISVSGNSDVEKVNL